MRMTATIRRSGKVCASKTYLSSGYGGIWSSWSRLTAYLIIRPFTRFERWRPDAGVDLFLKDANVLPVVSSIILQLGDFGSQFLDLPILVIHVLLDAICECTPVSGLLGCCFNLSMSSISATFLPGLVHGGSKTEYAATTDDQGGDLSDVQACHPVCVGSARALRFLSHATSRLRFSHRRVIPTSKAVTVRAWVALLWVSGTCAQILTAYCATQAVTSRTWWYTD